MMGEGREVVVMSPSAGGETAVEESVSNGSASEFSQSMCNSNKESMDSFARLCHLYLTLAEDGTGNVHTDRQNAAKKSSMLRSRGSSLPFSTRTVPFVPWPRPNAC